MDVVEKQILIDLPHADSWEKVRDISLAENYIPNVKKIEIVSAKKEGVGARRKAYLEKDGKIVDETVIAWQDDTGFTLELDVDGKRVLPWFDKFHFRYHIEPADHKTLFQPAILYQPRWKFMTGLQRRVFRCALGKELKVICASMKHYYETNTPTSKAMLKEIRKRV